MRILQINLQERFIVAIALVYIMIVSTTGGALNAGASSQNPGTQNQGVGSVARAVVTQTIDNMDPAWIYTGSWSSYWVSNAYLRQIHMSTGVGDYATITISGSSFTLVFLKAANFGEVDVYVDDSKIYTINQNNATTAYQVEWTSPQYSSASHQVKLVHVRGGNVDIDAIKVNAATSDPTATPTTSPTQISSPTPVPVTPTQVFAATAMPSPTKLPTQGATQIVVSAATSTAAPAQVSSPTVGVTATQAVTPTKTFTATANPTLTPTATSTTAPVSGDSTYYVATNGSDTNPGSQSQPWRTIQKAVNTVNTGATILVRAGTYNESVAISRSGAAGQEIKLSNYPGETVQIDSGSNMAIYSKGAVNYWTISGLRIKSTNQFTIQFGWWRTALTTHMTLQNNYINGAVFTVGNYQLFENNEISGVGYSASGGYGGINDTHGGLGDNATHHNIYRGNYIHDFTNANARGIWTQGRTHDITIENNRVENIWTSGLGQCIDLDAGATGLVQWKHTVRGNTIKDCSYVGIQLENVFASLVENNLVKAEKGGNAGIIDINYSSSIGCGVGGDSNQYGDTNGDGTCKGELTNNIIRQNIITKKGAWSAGYGGIVNWGAGALKILGNTIYASSASGNGAINFQASATENQQAVIQNNILYNGSGPAICAISFSSFAQDSNNLLYRSSGDQVYASGSGCSGAYSLSNYKTATGKGQNSVQADPQFISATNYDFHLQGTSPAIDQGVSIGIVTDLDGRTRPLGPAFDIGVYEIR